MQKVPRLRTRWLTRRGRILFSFFLYVSARIHPRRPQGRNGRVHNVWATRKPVISSRTAVFLLWHRSGAVSIIQRGNGARRIPTTTIAPFLGYHYSRSQSSSSTASSSATPSVALTFFLLEVPVRWPPSSKTPLVARTIPFASLSGSPTRRHSPFSTPRQRERQYMLAFVVLGHPRYANPWPRDLDNTTLVSGCHWQTPDCEVTTNLRWA